MFSRQTDATMQKVSLYCNLAVNKFNNVIGLTSSIRHVIKQTLVHVIGYTMGYNVHGIEPHCVY